MRRLLLILLLLPIAANAADPSMTCGTAVQCGATACEITPPTVSDNDLMIFFGGVSNATAIPAALDLNETGWTQQAQWEDTTGVDREMIVETKVASSESGTYTLRLTDDSSQQFVGQICVIPSGDFDSSSILDGTVVYNGANSSDSYNPAAYTTNTDGALGIVAMLAGNINSGNLNCNDGITGYTEKGDLFDTTPVSFGYCLFQKTITTAGSEDPATLTGLSTTTAANPNGAMISISPAASGPTFTSGPTEAPTTNGFTISGTLSGAGTLTAYAVGVNPGDGAPTCTQIKAGQNDGGTSADLSANEVWTTDVGDSFTLTRTGAWPRYDIHVCGSDGSTDTAVTSFTDQDRSADSGQTIQALSSVSATSPFTPQSENTCDTTSGSAILTGCADTSWIQAGMLVDLSAGFADLTDVIVQGVSGSTITLETAANATSSNITVTENAYFSPTVATGDVVEIDDLTSASKAVTIEADGDLVITGLTAVFQSVDYNVQDVSDAVSGDFDAGPQAWSGGDDKFYFYAERPSLNDADSEPILLIKDAAMSTYTFDCSDPQSLSVTVSNRTALPTGLSLASNGQLTGTPTVENETTGTTPVFDCSNDAGLYASPLDTVIYVTDDSVTMPDITGDTVSAALTTLLGSYPWLTDVSISVTGLCSTTVTEGDIISQTPAATTLTTATPTVTAVVSTGTAPCALRYRQ